VYAPVRTVVWEDGGANNPASYPIDDDKSNANASKRTALAT
jgi:hypothetical protein